MNPKYAYTSLSHDAVCPAHGEPVVRVDYCEGLPVYACLGCVGEGKPVRPPTYSSGASVERGEAK